MWGSKQRMEIDDATIARMQEHIDLQWEAKEKFFEQFPWLLDNPDKT